MNLRQPSSDAHNGLTGIRVTPGSGAYLDEHHFRTELERIWYRNWLHVCRAADVAEPRDFRTFRVGDQELLIIRDEAGELRGYHNTCRHRGSALKSEPQGRLNGRLIVCPYHAWSYSLDGRLVRVSSKSCPAGFDKADYPLYPVAITEWRGFVFVNLAAEPGSTINGTFDADPGLLANWPLERLRRVQTYKRNLKCNWKIFWENFNECLHCPGVHPELSALVPIYGRGLMERRDDPAWLEHADDEAPEYSGRLRNGAETWSRDGSAGGRSFAGLSAAERAAGQTYVSHLPSFFAVGHADYVRTVSLRPLSPTETELTAEWFFAEETMPADEPGMDNILAFGSLVLDQDAAICEVNQRGIASRAHAAGVLMPEEYEIARFHDWVTSQLA